MKNLKSVLFLGLFFILIGQTTEVFGVGRLVTVSSVAFNGAANNNDAAAGVAIDNSENIIVTGHSSNGANYDYFTIKYNSSLSVISSAAYNSAVNAEDAATGVAVDGLDNIIVAGYSDNGVNNDYFTIKYNSNLSVISSATYDGAANGGDYAMAAAVDGLDDIIVTGYSYNGANYDYFTIKYSSSLIVLSSAAYNGEANSDDFPCGVAVDNSGNIIVTGYSSNGSNLDYFTIKYSSSLIVLSSAAYNGAANGDDHAMAIAVDGSGNIIVTGYSSNGADDDFFTLKYDNNLNFLSSARYNGAANNFDIAYEVAVDNTGNIIVAGRTHNGANNDFFTIKYDNNLNAISSATYNGAANGDDYAQGVAIDGSGNIIVTGRSNNGTNRDYFTIKYSGQAVENIIDPGTDSIILLKVESGDIEIKIPANTFTEPVKMTVSVSAVPAPNKPTIKVGNICIDITNDKNLQPGKPITITMHYRDSDIAGLDESKLAICRYDELNNLSIPLPSTVDTANNVVTAITDHLSKFVLVQLAPAGDLASVKVYPNPLNSKLYSMTIANLTASADIKIYNVAGELIRKLDYTGGTGLATWDGKNDSGSLVASGVYIIYIKSDSGTKKIKVAVEK